MSRFGRLLRAIAAGTLTALSAVPTFAQEPTSLPDPNDPGNSNSVTPAGFGRQRKDCVPCPPVCQPYPCYPGIPQSGVPGTWPPVATPPDTGMPPTTTAPVAPDFGDLGRGAGPGSTVGLNWSPNLSGPQLEKLPAPGAFRTLLPVVSEDNSPLPRDRILFNYDYYDKVRAGALGSGIPVNRYVLGFEKAFLDGRVSFQTRIPFINALSSTAILPFGQPDSTGQFTRGTELGDLTLTTKALLWRGNVLNVSGGLGISLPTARDEEFFGVAAQTSNGDLLRQVFRYKTTGVGLFPFVALLYTPTERLFSQYWQSFGFLAGGVPVELNPALFRGVSTAGTYQPPTVMNIDWQIGYWVYQRQAGFLRGVAPFFEVHYLTDLGRGNRVVSPPDLPFGIQIDRGPAVDDLYLTGGVHVRFCESTVLTVGAVASVLGESRRLFDFQVGFRLNYYFGGTNFARSGAGPAVSFR